MLFLLAPAPCVRPVRLPVCGPLHGSSNLGSPRVPWSMTGPASSCPRRGGDESTPRVADLQTFPISFLLSLCTYRLQWFPVRSVSHCFPLHRVVPPRRESSLVRTVAVTTGRDGPLHRDRRSWTGRPTRRRVHRPRPTGRPVDPVSGLTTPSVGLEPSGHGSVVRCPVSGVHREGRTASFVF